MALPKIKHPTYKHFLHGLGKEVHYRPFTNAEQKVLLLAKESEDAKQVITAISQILTNCIVDKVDIDSLCSFDIEDIFLRIRAKSVGEVIDTRFKYNYEDDKGAEKTDFVKVSINIDDIKVHVKEDLKDTVIVDEENSVGIKLRYPSLKDMENMDTSNADNDMKLISKCVACVFDANEVYNRADISDKEMDEFLDSIETKKMVEVSEFFQNMPKLKHSVEVYMPKLDKKETITFEGINDFFI